MYLYKHKRIQIYRAITGSGGNNKSERHDYGNQFQTLICSFEIPRCLEQENGVSVTMNCHKTKTETTVHIEYHFLDGA